MVSAGKTLAETFSGIAREPLHLFMAACAVRLDASGGDIWGEFEIK
jgi:hypothetical protein